MKPHVFEDKNTPPEIRAYIYQQLTDLERLLPQGSAISITVEDKSLLDKNTKPNAPKKVVIYLETSIGNLLAESKNKDVFKAIKVAKEHLKAQLSTLQGVLVRPEDRANEIENIIRHPYLH